MRHAGGDLSSRATRHHFHRALPPPAGVGGKRRRFAARCGVRHVRLRERRTGFDLRRGCELELEGAFCRRATTSGLGIRLDAGFAYWEGRGRPTPYGHLWDFNLTPVFRWTFAEPAAPRLFAEGGIGANLISTTRINNDRIFSTAFQFGEMAAGGVAFGPRNEYELRLYVQHVSNADIKRPNWGLTYPGMTFSVALP